MHHILIVGLGNFGNALIDAFQEKGCEVTVIEMNQEKAQVIKDLVHQVVVADATNKEILMKFAKGIDCGIICVGTKIDTSLLITHYLKEIGVKKIIAKATSDDHGSILKIVGAHEVVFPEKDIAQKVANSLIAPNILDFIKLSEGFDMVEMAVPDKFIKHTIQGLQLRSKYGIEILAIKNPLTDEMEIMPSPEYEFKPDDVLYALGKVDSLKKIRDKD